MSKKTKILLVANSVPLPATDFLKYKLFGLSKLFDLHMICWDNKKTRQTFYDKYSDKLNGTSIHLYYDKWNTVTFLKLVFVNIFRGLFFPHIGIPLKLKLIKEYGWNVKELFVKFNLYFPIIKINPDIVHFEYGTLAHMFGDIKNYVNCKVSTSFRGYDINYVGLEKQDYYKAVWDSFDGVHFLGHDLKNRASKRGYRGQQEEAIIAPAIDTSFFTPQINDKPKDKLIVISVGRLAWKKGYEYGLQAIAQLKAKGIPVAYRIVANGTYLQPILFAIEELGLQEEVSIISVTEHETIREKLDKAHVFLHPAISEGFSNAVLEAQAMGLPVVTTDADGLAENIEDKVTGFVVPIYDAHTMAERLAWCYNNMEQVKEMGQAGIKRVHTHFKIEEQIDKFAAFYKRLNEQ